MTLQTMCKPLGFAGCTATGLLPTLKAPQNIPVFLGKALNASTPVTFAGATTHAFNPWIRMVSVKPNGSYTDLTGKWLRG
jgi:hypothetical protein